MLWDPTVRACVDVLKAAVVSDGLQLLPAVESDAAAGLEAVEPEDRSEVVLAAEIRDACEDWLDELDEPLDGVLWQWLDAIPLGSMAAEVIWREADGESYRYALSGLHVKPRSAWGFLLSEAGEVIGFEASIPGGGGRGGPRLPRRKMAVLSWLPKHRDPRGTPALDAVYDPWNQKVLTRPEYWIYLSRFANPHYFGTTAEDAQPVEDRDDAGKLTGRVISPQQAMLSALLKLPEYKAAVGGHGSTLQRFGSEGEGGAFPTAFNRWDVEIVVGLLKEVRPAAGLAGGRNDPEAPTDDLTSFARAGKKALADAFRTDVLTPIVLENWGPRARNLVPHVQLGAVDLPYFSRIAGAFARLAQVGFFPPAVVPEVLGTLGLTQLGRRVRQVLATAPAAVPPPAPDSGGSPGPGPMPMRGPGPMPMQSP